MRRGEKGLLRALRDARSTQLLRSRAPSGGHHVFRSRCVGRCTWAQNGLCELAFEAPAGD